MSTTSDKVQALVIGAGPAGLMAAEVLAEAGAHVVVVDAMPSPARKFLMAGKSGLNLTKAEPIEAFLLRFADAPPEFLDVVRAFGPEDVAAWAKGLGETLYTGSTGRVFPRAMKASPLLRAWLARLTSLDVDLRRRWRWTGWDGDGVAFQTPEGARLVHADVCVMALGGASWPRLGSTGNWTEIFAADGIATQTFKPSNVALSVDWSRHMAGHFGAAVKSVRLMAGGVVSRGEFVVTRSGLEGGGIYEVSMAVRDGAPLVLDLTPGLSAEEVLAKLSKPRGKASISNHLRKSLGLGPVQRALLMEWSRPLPEGAGLAAVIKALKVRHSGPASIESAISIGGGVDWAALNGLQLVSRPNTFVAGEMLNWEAPTGGYLLTGCLATGSAAGQQAANYLRISSGGLGTPTL